MLKVSSLSKNFGGIKALDNLTLEVEDGEIHGLIGPNGSGKSTTVNLISGLYAPSSGTVEFLGSDITALPLHRRTGVGISRTFQNIRLFGKLSVWKNLWVAQQGEAGAGMGGFLRRWAGGEGKARETIDEILEFSSLQHKRDVAAANLSFGEQRRLELARAIAAKPRLILMDEPAAGMNQEEIADLEARIRDLKRRGATVLLIEHHMDLVMSVSDRITVLNFGRKIAEGTAEAVQSDPAVQEAYLGVAA
ncbi:ABC transporter ATP-binding protein [Mesorhizobium sp. CN2-181]|uniref:ABC transporter ATP-binding protein n=1 Tax=Mesorhizobium yinganensis TaxID=3157707 RepID=UPI0032B73CDD